MVAPAPLLEANAPGYLQRFVLRLHATFLGLFPNAPVRLWSVADAGLPDPAKWAGCVVYVSDKAKVGLSNGASWTDTSGGAL